MDEPWQIGLARARPFSPKQFRFHFPGFVPVKGVLVDSMRYPCRLKRELGES